MGVLDNIEKKQKEIPAAQEEFKFLENATPTTKRLFEAAVKEFEDIKEVIKTDNSGKYRARRLVLNKIAENAKMDRSNLSERRQPELVWWIKEKNKELETLSRSLPEKIRRKPGMTKKELVREVSELRAQSEEQQKKELRTVVESFFADNLLDKQATLAKKNRQLRDEKHKLNQKVERLETILRDQEQQISTLLQKMTPAQRLEVGSLQPAPTGRDKNGK